MRYCTCICAGTPACVSCPCLGSRRWAAADNVLNSAAATRRFEAWYQDGDARHLVTEYAEAGDLLGAIKAAATGGGHLEEGQIMAWFVQVGAACIPLCRMPGGRRLT